MNETTLYLVRHGETEWNQQRRVQGQRDSALTEDGRRQAKATGQALRGLGIDAIVASDSGRARDTAELVNKGLQVDLSFDQRLRERGFGELEGLTIPQATERFGPEAIHSVYHEINYDGLGIESLQAFSRRLTEAVDRIAERFVGRTALAITHGGALGALFRHAVGLPVNAPRRFELRNCAINRLLIRDDGWHIDLWGDTFHLRQPALDEQTADSSAP